MICYQSVNEQKEMNKAGYLVWLVIYYEDQDVSRVYVVNKKKIDSSFSHSPTLNFELPMQT